VSLEWRQVMAASTMNGGRMGGALMLEAERSALQAAIELLHGCRASFRAVEVVSVTIEGRRAWRRSVATFELQSHPDATICYAWVDANPAGQRYHHRVVLQTGPVRSAHDAVKAFLLAETRVAANI
jgi:hypothetical protein